jgi:hypothetical protein
VQCAIANLSRLHDVGREIIRQGPRAAVNFQPITFRQRINSAELKHAFRATFKTAQHSEQIGNDHVVGLAKWLNDFSTREHTGDVAKPALQNLNVNPQGERIESTDLDLLAPVCRRVGIQIISVETLQAHVMRLADVIFGEDFFDHHIAA